MIHNRMSSYIDLGTLKDSGNLEGLSSNTTYDNMLLYWAESCSQFIDDYCKRHFDFITDTLYFDGAGRVLNLPVDLFSITSMDLDDGSGNFATSVNVNTDIVAMPTYKKPIEQFKPTLSSSVGTFASNVPKGVRIIGIWGYGIGTNTTSPYINSGVTTTIATTSGTTITVSADGAIKAGMNLLVGTEQMYVTATGTGSFTAYRGVNGTTAATHTTATTYIYQTHPVVSAATMVQLQIWWARRQSAYASKVGNAQTGEFEIYKGLDDGVRAMLSTGDLKRKVI